MALLLKVFALVFIVLSMLALYFLHNDNANHAYASFMDTKKISRKHDYDATNLHIHPVQALTKGPESLSQTTISSTFDKTLATAEGVSFKDGKLSIHVEGYLTSQLVKDISTATDIPLITSDMEDRRLSLHIDALPLELALSTAFKDYELFMHYAKSTQKLSPESNESRLSQVWLLSEGEVAIERLTENLDTDSAANAGEDKSSLVAQLDNASLQQVELDDIVTAAMQHKSEKFRHDFVKLLIVRRQTPSINLLYDIIQTDTSAIVKFQAIELLVSSNASLTEKIPLLELAATDKDEGVSGHANGLLLALQNAESD